MICQSDSTSSRYASNSSSARSISSMSSTGGGPSSGLDRPQQRPLDEEALLVQLGLEGVGACARPTRRSPRRRAGGGAGGRSPSRRRPGRRRCPRSTAGGSARRRSSARAPWRPRSCRRRPRPRAAAAGAATARGTPRWPAPRRGGSRGWAARPRPRRRGGSPAIAARLLAGRWPAVSDVEVRVLAAPASAVEQRAFRRTGNDRARRARLRSTRAQWVDDVSAGTVYGLVADGDGVHGDPSKVLLARGRGRCCSRRPRAPLPRDAAVRRRRARAARRGRPAPAAAPSRRRTRRPVVYEAHVVASSATRAGARHLRRSRRRPRPPRRPRRDRGRAAAGAPVDPRRQLLGLHAAGVAPCTGRSRPATTPPSWTRRRGPRRATSRCGSTWCSTTRPRATRRADVHLRGSTTPILLPRRPRLVHRDERLRQRHRPSRPRPRGPRDLLARPLRRPRVDGFRFDLRRRAAATGRSSRRSTHGRPSGVQLSPSRGTSARTSSAPPCRAEVGRSGTTASVTTCAASCAPNRPRAGHRAACAGQPRPVRRAAAERQLPRRHDGFTLYDLVSYDHKHNAANGWGGTDGTDDNRSWNCGWEGDDDVPADVLALRSRR